MGAKKGGDTPTKLTLIDGALDNAKPAPKVGRPREGSAQEEEPELPMLPAGCPVEPCGVNGQIHYYLDEQRQLIGLDPQKHGKTHIIALFGRKAKLVHRYWPRYSDKTGQDGKPIVTGWKPEVAAEALMGACAMERIFDPQGRVRGTGAHRDDDGELVLHCGDQVFITGVHAGYVEPGKIGRYIYPAGPSRPRPDPSEQDAKAGEILLMKLRAWQWARALVDPMLLLGWVGAAMVGGALDWRPHAWVTGSSATGKSTLQKLLRALFDGAALTTGNATEASLRQLLKQQTLPVLFDELEAAEDSRKTTAVIELARVASSGDQVLRGGQDHQGQEFTVRSCFLFSSILLPPMNVQDKNRLAILELERLEAGAASPSIDLAELRDLGRRLRRRLVDHWHRLDQLVDRYKTALGSEGHSGRAQDQFGTLLAIADLLLYDEVSQDNVLEWAVRLKADTLAEKVTELADEQAIVHKLSTSFVLQKGGDEPMPVVRHIRRALESDGDTARDRLENFGLRIVEARWGTDKAGNATCGACAPRAVTPHAELYLAVANSHEGIARIFADTHWKGGTWQQSLGRVTCRIAKDGELVERPAIRRVKVRFAGDNGIWSTLIPLPSILDLNQEDVNG
jgi:hypothetical protein